MKFAELLKNHRIKQGMLQSDLSDTIGVTQSYYNKLEKGFKPPSFDKINMLIKKLNIMNPAEQFRFIRVAFEERCSTDDMQYIKALKRLSNANNEISPVEYLSQNEIMLLAKDYIDEKLGVLTDDETLADILFHPDTLKILQELSHRDADQRDKTLKKIINALESGLL